MHPQTPTKRLAVSAALAFLSVGGVAGCAKQLLAAHGTEGSTPITETTCMKTSPDDTQTFAWRRLGSDRDTPIMDDWCAAVGPAVFQGPGITLNPAHSDSLVVVSWNVHVGGGDLVRFVDDLRRGTLTGGAPVESFVLLLQEVHRGGADVPTTAPDGSFARRIDVRPPEGDRMDVVDAAHHLGLHLLYAPSMRNGGPDRIGAEDRGNAILSTMTLTGPEAIELPYEVQRRVAVAGTVSGVGSAGTPWSLRVVSAHLDNRSTLTRFWDSFGSGRARQARALAEAVTDEHAIVGADLNSWSAGFLESAVPILLGRFPGTPAGPTGTYKAAGVIPRTLDHLLFRLPTGSEAKLHRAPTMYGSDHYPLIALLALPA